MKPDTHWSIRVWDKFVDYYYAENPDFPNWVWVTSRRFWKETTKWQGE